MEDAVATQDTVTMLRGVIRGLLRACPPPLAAKVHALLRRDDDYTAPGKPACDWQDRAAREGSVDALVGDGYRAHYALRGQRLDPRVAEVAALLATVTGQDIEETPDGRFRIFAGTAPDRVISTDTFTVATGSAVLASQMTCSQSGQEPSEIDTRSVVDFLGSVA